MTRLRSMLVVSFIVALLFMSFVGSTKARDEWPGRDIVVVAHRGLAPGYPENTLPAFRHALELGVGFIELDLRMTKDGIPVVIHDDTVDRTTDGQGEVGTFTLAQIKKLDAGSLASPRFAGERIPTLKETLELVTSLGGKALLDIKSSTDLDCEKVVRLVEHYNAVNDVIVGARTVKDVKLFRSLNPNIRILGFIGGARDIKKFVAAGVDIIRLWPRWIRLYPPLVEQVHKLGKPVWTTAGLAGREELGELIKVGVDGILTDLPGVLLALLGDIRAEHREN